MTATSGDAPRPPPSAASNTGGNSTTYGKSWAEDLQKYHAAKATLPWRPEQQTTVTHVTRYEKSRQEREYDLVLGRFRNAEKELKRQETDASQRTHSLEHSRANQLRTVQRFNVINHSPMYAGARDPEDLTSEAYPPRRTTNVSYNIVNNVPRDGLTSPSPLAVTPSSPVSSAARRRDFNILTNKFHDHHDQRERAEQTSAKESAAVKFTKKNTFHPVRIAFYDPEKETQFLDARERDQQLHGHDRLAKLPPREQFAEGKIYNIVNQSVLNQSQIQRYDGHGERAQSKMQQHAYETRMLSTGQQLAEREEQLCLNRFAHARHAQAFVHGFDPITNEPFEGIHAKARVATRTHATLPAWHVLEQGIPSTTKIAVAHESRKLETKAPHSQPERGASDGGAERRANILVVDYPTKTSTPAKIVETPAIRTGGFHHTAT